MKEHPLVQLFRRYWVPGLLGAFAGLVVSVGYWSCLSKDEFINIFEPPLMRTHYLYPSGTTPEQAEVLRAKEHPSGPGHLITKQTAEEIDKLIRKGNQLTMCQALIDHGMAGSLIGAALAVLAAYICRNFSTIREKVRRWFRPV